MKLDDYLKELKDLMESVKKGDLPEEDLQTRLSVYDNYPILLEIDPETIIKKIKKDLKSFEFARNYEEYPSNRKVTNFNYLPGTVVMGCGKKISNLGNFKGASINSEKHRGWINDNYNTWILLNPYQGQSSYGMSDLYPGKHMDSTPDNVAIGLVILELSDFIRSNKIPACLPTRFYKHPIEVNVSGIVYYPDKVDDKMFRAGEK